MGSAALLIAALLYAACSADLWLIKKTRPFYAAAIFCYGLANCFLVLDMADQ